MKPILIPVRFGLLHPDDRARVARLVDTVDAKFRLSAKHWEMGQNSGNAATLALYERQSERIATEAEAMLAPLGIKCTWPGLYPCFEVNGYTEHSTEMAVLSALGKPRNWLRKEAAK